jgi:pre-mRNA-processing factor SLU7
MSHKTKDCLERPRVKGAKFTGKNIAADDKIQDIHLSSFDAKRDRWNGFDTNEYSKVVERYDKLEAIRKEMKQQEKVQEAYKDKEAGDKAKGGAGEEGGAAAVAGEVDVDDDVKIAEDEEAGECGWEDG